MALVSPSTAPDVAYGGVVIDDHFRVLLRRPPGDFDGYVWTFPKGSAARGEGPAEAAARQVAEETGWSAVRPTPLPGRFRGGTRPSEYFIFAPGGPAGMPDPARTRDVRWAGPDEAERLIAETRNGPGRERDRAVLAAALALAERRRAGERDPPPRRPSRAEADALLRFLPGFDRPDREYLTWSDPEVEGDAVVMPHPVYEPDVWAFFEAAGGAAWTDPGYRPGGAAAMLAHRPLVASCDVDQLRTMLTYCVRWEKFCDGHWARVLADGSVRALLRRLADLRDSLAEG